MHCIGLHVVFALGHPGIVWDWMHGSLLAEATGGIMTVVARPLFSADPFPVHPATNCDAVEIFDVFDLPADLAGEFDVVC